jgi:hypothetical protein
MYLSIIRDPSLSCLQAPRPGACAVSLLHSSWKPIGIESRQSGGTQTATGIADARDHVVGGDVDDENGGEGDGEEENDDHDLDEIWQHNGRTFEEEMEVILDSAKGLSRRSLHTDFPLEIIVNWKEFIQLDVSSR